MLVQERHMARYRRNGSRGFGGFSSLHTHCHTNGKAASPASPKNPQVNNATKPMICKRSNAVKIASRWFHRMFVRKTS